MTDYFTYSVTSTGLVIPLTLTGITLNSGDTLDATEGGTAIDTTVNAGGSMSVSNEPPNGPGTASGTIIDAGGMEDVDGGRDFNATINSGGAQFVVNGGTATDAVVFNGGTLIVGPDGTVIGTVVSSSVLSSTNGLFIEGGTAINTILDSGFEGVAGAGSFVGTDISATVNGGIQGVFNGGTAIAAVVENGGTQEVIEGTASSTTVSSGGSVIVTLSGSVTAATLIVAGQSATDSATVTVFGSGATLTAPNGATLGSAAPDATNSNGDPNGTCGDWSYTAGGVGQITAFNGD